jgi:hypothetical protein
MIPFSGDLTPPHGFPLRNGGQGLGIEGRIFSANGAFPIYTDFSSGLGMFYFIHGILLPLEYTLFWGMMQLLLILGYFKNIARLAIQGFAEAFYYVKADLFTFGKFCQNTPRYAYHLA